MSSKNVVASVMQQSRQRVPQSWTEYRERPKATWVQTVRRHDELMTSGRASMMSLCYAETGMQTHGHKLHKTIYNDTSLKIYTEKYVRHITRMHACSKD